MTTPDSLNPITLEDAVEALHKLKFDPFTDMGYHLGVDDSLKVIRQHQAAPSQEIMSQHVEAEKYGTVTEVTNLPREIRLDFSDVNNNEPLAILADTLAFINHNTLATITEKLEAARQAETAFKHLRTTEPVSVLKQSEMENLCLELNKCCEITGHAFWWDIPKMIGILKHHFRNPKPVSVDLDKCGDAAKQSLDAQGYGRANIIVALQITRAVLDSLKAQGVQFDVVE